MRTFFIDFLKRSLTAMVWIPLIYASIYFDIADHLILFCAVVLYSELLLAVYNCDSSLQKKSVIFATGFLYLLYGIFSLLEISENNLEMIWMLLCAVFSIDFAGYIFGNIFKGPKLIPTISPNKTISGFLSATVTGYFSFRIFISNDMNYVSVFAIMFAIFVQIGDYFISFGKRNLKLKNASKLLPGFGGFWDRFDSIFAGSLFVYYLKLKGLI